MRPGFRNKQIGGFTLIELVLVIIMVAILAVVALVRFQPAETTLGAQADRLARHLRHVQIIALSSGQQLRLSTGGTTYSVACATASANWPCNATPIIDPATGQAFTVNLDNGVTIGGGPLDLDFLGRPVDAVGTLLAGDSTFTLTGGAQTSSVTVRPVSGFVVRP